MFGVIVLFHISNAESKSNSASAGVFWNEIAVESSMGFQRYHHGIGGWWQRCQQSPNSKWTMHQPMQDCWQHNLRTGMDAQTIPSSGSGLLDTHLLTSTLTLDTLKGVSFGDESVRVGFFAGAGLDLYLGGANVLAASVKPSLVTDVQVQLPLHDHILWISGGHRIWLHRANPMISLGWGTQW